MTPDQVPQAVTDAGFTEETFGPAIVSLAMLAYQQTARFQR